jgi:hypothetical protein
MQLTTIKQYTSHELERFAWTQFIQHIHCKQSSPDHTVSQLTTVQHTTTAALPSILLRLLLEIHVSSFRMMKTCCGELVCLLFRVNAVIFKEQSGENAVSFRVRSSLNFTCNSKQTADPVFQTMSRGTKISLSREKSADIPASNV